MAGPPPGGPGGPGGPGAPGGPGGVPGPMPCGPMGQGPGGGGPAFGYRGFGPGGPGGPHGQMPPDAVLKEAFGFTDAQLASLKTLRETQRASVEALQKQIADGRRVLDEVLNAENPEPAKVGSAMLAVRGAEKQMPKIEETFRTGFKALLTPAQKQKLAEIEAVRAAQELRHLGL